MALLRPGFTLVELLILLFILGLLTTLVVTGASKAIDVQRANTTRARMGAIMAAIDQFSAENPLAAKFDAQRSVVGAGGRFTVHPSFGRFPPYSLAGDDRLTAGGNASMSVRAIVEPDVTAAPYQVSASYAAAPPANFEERIASSLGWKPGQGAALDQFVTPRNTRSDLQDDRGNDDIRSLYSFLRVYSAGALSQVPQDAIRPLTERPEMIYPKGNRGGHDAANAAANVPDGAVNVLGFFDAWGVPFDYFVYAKIEFTNTESGIYQWRITDRVPVLRSHGLTRETFRAYQSERASRMSDAGALAAYDQRFEASALYSSPLPSPPARVGPRDERDPDEVSLVPASLRTGFVPNPASQQQLQYAIEYYGGWVRLKHGSGTGNGRDLVESYGYRDYRP